MEFGCCDQPVHLRRRRAAAPLGPLRLRRRGRLHSRHPHVARIWIPGFPPRRRLLPSGTRRHLEDGGCLLHRERNGLGTAVTKLKIRQKEALGVAEKRGGRRGPGSVIGSSAAGCVCALLSIYNVGGGALAGLWRLGFVASFCTKLSDTVSSEIGKAYGRTTYLVTTFKIVPKGTEGAVSVEGTLAGIVAAMFLSGVGYSLGQVNIPQCVLCVLASQIANFGESIIGATLQDKEGFEWLNNDVVNVINISAGGILAVLMQWLLLPA
ncbi:unnamed protein product [Alopecurus aequalis]